MDRQLCGLPVRVIDEKDAWTGLKIGDRAKVGSLEWKSRAGASRESSTSTEVTFQVMRKLDVADIVSSPQLPPNVTSSTSIVLETTVPPPVASSSGLPGASPGDRRPGSSSALAGSTWYCRPYVYLFVVVAPDVEAYRESGPRKRLRQFAEACSESKVESVIVYAPPLDPRLQSSSTSAVPSSATSGKRFWDSEDAATRMQRKVLEKLRLEVNVVKGKDRIAVVRTPQDFQTELLPKLREYLRDAVEARIQAYEDEIHRVFSNRLLPGWSFCEFFVLKEGMSFIYAQLGRQDIALRCYDELSANMTERDDIGSGFGGTDDGDDCAIGLTNPLEKKFSEEIRAGTITELNFRIYLFARQLSLLVMDQKYAELADRGKRFIGLIARRTREEAIREGSSLPLEFREAWSYSAALALVGVLEPVVLNAQTSNGVLVGQRERNLARLIAGIYLMSLKSFSALVSQTNPGALWDYLGEEGGEEVRGTKEGTLNPQEPAVSDPELKAALGSIKAAEDRFSELSSKAANYYELGGRLRSAYTLIGNAGRIHLRNRSYDRAQVLLSQQSRMFNRDGCWQSIYARCREDLALSEKVLGLQQDFLVSCLSMLTMCRRVNQEGFLTDDAESPPSLDAQKWADEVESVARNLPHGSFKFKLDRLFQTRFLKKSESWREGDEGSADLVIESDLSCRFKIDSVSVSFRARTPRRSLSAIEELTRTKSFVRSASKFNVNSFEMTCTAPFDVTHGTNIVQVSASEVPWSGFYEPGQITLFVGKLKIVRKFDSSAPLQLSDAEEDALPATLSSRLARKTVFHSFERPDSATMTINDPSELYFVPEAWQAIPIEIEAGPMGIARDSTLRVELSVPSDTVSAASISLLAPDSFQTEDQVLPSSTRRDGALLLAFNLDEDSTTSGSFHLKEELQPNQRLLGIIAVSISFVEPAILGHSEESSQETSGSLSDGWGCSLHCVLIGSELSAKNSRQFECVTALDLRFRRPVMITASVKRIMEDKAMVSCVLRNCRGSGRVTIRDATLSLPKWGAVNPPRPLRNILPMELTSGSSLALHFPVDLTQAAALQEIDDAFEDTNALLRVDARCSHIVGDVVFEGMVDLESLQTRRKRFVSHCEFDRSGILGQALKVRYRISHASALYSGEPTSILFGLDLNESAWMVFGRVRTEAILEEEPIEIVVSLLPLRTGRLIVPSIFVLEVDGLVVDDQTYSKRGEIWVKPSSDVTVVGSLVET